MTISREKLVSLIKWFEEAGRYDTMNEYAQKLIKIGDKISKEERELFSRSYSHLIAAKRTSLRVYLSIEHKEEMKKCGNIEMIKNEILKLKKEMTSLYDQIFSLINKEYISSIEDSESRAYFWKMIADYNRYLCDVYTDKELETVKQNTIDAYNEAQKASIELFDWNQVKLGVILNSSVFHYDMMGDRTKALKIAREGFENAIKHIDTLNENDYRDAVLILGLLRDNLTVWTYDGDEDE